MFNKTPLRDYSKKIDELSMQKEVRLYNKYVILSPFDYGELIRKWNEYYIKARQSFPALNYNEQMVAYRDKVMQQVKECAEVATLWLKEGERLETPSEEDPRVIESCTAVQTYINLKFSGNKSDDIYTGI